MLLKLLILAIPAVLVVPSASAFEGNSGTIAFTGTLASETCTLSEDSKNKEIIVGNIPRGDVQKSIVYFTDFTLDILCDSHISGTAGISFTGTNLLGISLLPVGFEKTKTIYSMRYIPANGQPEAVGFLGNTQHKLKLKPGTNTFPFELGHSLLTGANSAHHGSINASANYTIHYE